MPEILALLQNIAPVVSVTILHQLSQVIYGMLISNGRITMLEISRWTERGGSYRTIQRLYHGSLLWLQIQWLFFTCRLQQPDHEYITAGDEVVFGKAGTETYGLGRFFSSLQKRVIPGLSFFTFSVIDVTERHSYPIHAVQMIKGKDQTPPRATGKIVSAEKRPVGRPKGSQNKKGDPPSLNPELRRIQPVLQAFLKVLTGVLAIQYLVLDGHFGNYPSAWMVLQTGLQLVSKLRCDAALYEPFTGKYSGHGRRPKYGAKIDARQMNKKFLKSDRRAKGIRTQTYQATLLNKEFAFPINVVIILKTNLSTQKQAHILLFSTDLKLVYEKLVDYYSLRFQIEFNFRDAKQYWGLDDFMNVKERSVTNAANLAFFMVNFSSVLLRPFRETNSEFSVLDLKAHYRGYRYVSETIKLLPQKPDGILLDKIFEQTAHLGMVHPIFEPVSTA
jgi:putative transposase